jgi:hypothetical protein
VRKSYREHAVAMLTRPDLIASMIDGRLRPLQYWESGEFNLILAIRACYFQVCVQPAKAGSHIPPAPSSVLKPRKMVGAKFSRSR